MAAPKGNQNALKAKIWSAAIMRALERRNQPNGIEEIDRMADRFLDLVASGEQWAMIEFGNRLEGKPPQALVHSGDDGAPVRVDANVRLVKPGV